MPYYFAKTLDETDFEAVITRVTDPLSAEGFGILTDIDVEATMQKKLGESFRPYRILGACNPQFAHQALSQEDKIGTMLPCNVVVQQLPDGDGIEVAAVNPVASMQAVESEALEDIAGEVRERLKRVVDRL